MPAQGNRHPFANFGKHYMVKIGTQIYDPSYGMKYKSIEDFVNMAVDGFFIEGEVLFNEVRHNAWLIRKH